MQRPKTEYAIGKLPFDPGKTKHLSALYERRSKETQR
jgi:hypothetical protein